MTEKTELDEVGQMFMSIHEALYKIAKNKNLTDEDLGPLYDVLLGMPTRLRKLIEHSPDLRKEAMEMENEDNSPVIHNKKTIQEVIRDWICERYEYDDETLGCKAECDKNCPGKQPPVRQVLTKTYRFKKA